MSRLEVADYRHFLDQELCWFDGNKTHGSSGPQRQCPLCRTKWNFKGRLRNHLLLIEYCHGHKAGTAAARVTCSRNTAQTRFRALDRRVKRLAKQMLNTGGIAIATEPSTLQNLKRLQKTTGRRTPAEATARYLFFHGLDLQERVRLLSEPDLLEIIHRCRSSLANSGELLPAADGLLAIRRKLTDGEWKQWLGNGPVE